MKIDLREIPVVWINLDSAKQNAEKMNQRFQKYGFKHTFRKAGLIIPPPPGTDKSIAHFKGCGKSHIDILDNKDYSSPLLVLEDDIEFTDSFNPVIDIPDDSDGVYLGISHGNLYYQTCRHDENYLRIAGVLAAHAILYVTPAFREAMSNIGKHCLNVLNRPWDMGTAAVQQHFKVYTPNEPVIYQSNESESSNKWQNLTDKGLEDRKAVFQ
jgi:hypothetical protein